MSEQNKIDEIKAEYQMAEELFKRQPQMRDKFDQVHDWIGYLLAEIERKDEALRFYADEDIYVAENEVFDDGYKQAFWSMKVVEDRGEQAREAL